ncbi:MAG: hypothetical protein AAF570_14910, partial [Bacteroidota bacterium]
SQVSSDLKYVTPGDPDEIKFPSWANYPDPDPWTANYNNFRVEAKIGSGQFYFSNEIAYRASNLRNTLKPTLKQGHIHVGFLHEDLTQRGLLDDRDDMLNAVNYMLEKMLNAL